ncbi:MAG: CsgG/HfaB family protein [candidate division Zixibacteria bacterium]|nr:CsgG/HfaB family protein [candidate division Zixibacteria bacterium]
MRSLHLFRVVLCLTAIVMFLGVFAAAQIKENVTYQGNKARITVGTIKAKADECSGDMAAAIGEMLSTALAQSGKFIVLANQEEVEELADEIELGQSDYVEEGRGPEQGLMEGADILVTGAVTSFEPDAGGGGGGIGGLKKKAFGSVGLKTKTAEAGIDLKLIDIRTRRIIKATAIEAKSTSWGTDVAGGGWGEEIAMAGELGVYSNEPMEKAIRALLVKTVEKIEKEVPGEYYRYQGKGQYTQEYGASSGKTTAASGGTSAGASGGSGGGAVRSENMSLYTKYDFIPGDKTIFYDDLSGEEVGEFPSRWKLSEGVFEVAKKGDLTLIMCSDEGTIRPKMTPGLPDRYTVEWEIFSNGADQKGHWYYIHILDANEKTIASFDLTDGKSTKVWIFDKEMASKELTSQLGRGIHTMRIMATKTTMKCYVDNERVANIPDIEYFEPAAFRIHCDPWDDQGNPMLFGKFRVAEGGKSMRQQLDETGKIITHGILFDSGSDVIKGESFKTLAEIGQLLSDDPNLRLTIEGHTDSDGEDAYNQDLSQRRAASVKSYLVGNNQIDAARLESKGFGETKPIDANTTPEGKANNRRVELVKL